jgi:mono/diheme cytochrome c family protein
MFGAMWSFSRYGDGPYERSDNYSENRTYPGRGMYPGSGMYPEGVSPSYNKTDFESNGEMIYYTGINESGERIETEYGPHWLYTHGGSCVDCHGTDGRGGYPIMMGSEISPDIRYESLVSENHTEEEEHPLYTDEAIKRAIREGIDPAGEPLDLTMPRWKMTDKDVNDVVEYLKTL